MAVAISQKERFASIAHDVAASYQVSIVQTQGLEKAYAEGWYVERDPSFQTTFLKTKQPRDMYYAFAVTRSVQVDLFQRDWSSSDNPMHCHKRHQYRTCHQRCQRTSRGTDSTNRIANSNRDNNSHDFVIPLDASQHHIGADILAQTANIDQNETSCQTFYCTTPKMVSPPTVRSTAAVRDFWLALCSEYVQYRTIRLSFLQRLSDRRHWNNQSPSVETSSVDIRPDSLWNHGFPICNQP